MTSGGVVPLLECIPKDEPCSCWQPSTMQQVPLGPAPAVLAPVVSDPGHSSGMFMCLSTLGAQPSLCCWGKEDGQQESLEHKVRPRLANIIAGIFSTFVALSSGCLSMVFWKHSRLLICLHWDELCTVLCHWSVSDLDFCFLVLHTYECCLTYCLVGAIYNCLATNEACVKMKPITYSYQFFY